MFGVLPEMEALKTTRVPRRSPLQPIIQNRTVDLHPAVILLAVAAGASLFGILGAYLAVPVTAVVFTVVSSIGSDSAAPGAAP
jgi:predicted PurR-regulated permease PerM